MGTTDRLKYPQTQFSPSMQRLGTTQPEIWKSKSLPAHPGIVLLINTLLSGCISASRTPNLERIFAEARAKTGKRPVIVIPGVLGTQLINSKTGEMIWPSAFRSSDMGSTLPVTPGPGREPRRRSTG